MVSNAKGANIMADIDMDELILKTTMAIARALEQAGAAAEGHTTNCTTYQTGTTANDTRQKPRDR